MASKGGGGVDSEKHADVTRVNSSEMAEATELKFSVKNPFRSGILQGNQIPNLHSIKR